MELVALCVISFTYYSNQLHCEYSSTYYSNQLHCEYSSTYYSNQLHCEYSSTGSIAASVVEVLMDGGEER